LLAGNLGSHHSAIPVSAFRGFAIADPIAPFIVINDGDAKAAWSFTLLHELVHLWLGATGVSGGVPEMQIERFCNEVAGAFLLSPVDLQALQVVGDDLDAQIQQAST
jgi:Zn-dependent peptidase ImmA (M78 family)